MSTTALQTQGQGRRRGRRCSRCWSSDSLTAPGAAHGEAAVPLEPMKDHRGAEIHLQPMEDPTVELWVPEGGCDPVGSLPWNRLQAGPVAYGERSPHWRTFAGSTCDPMGDPCWNSLFLRDCIPWEGSH